MKAIKTGYSIIYSNCVTRIDFGDIVECLLDDDSISLTNKYGHQYYVDLETEKQRKDLLMEFANYCNTVSEVRDKRLEKL